MNLLRTYEGSSCIIHYNSDLSGDVEIVTGIHGESSISVSGKDLLDFVANFVRDEQMSILENSSTEDILGIRRG